MDAIGLIIFFGLAAAANAILIMVGLNFIMARYA